MTRNYFSVVVALSESVDLGCPDIELMSPPSSFKVGMYDSLTEQELPKLDAIPMSPEMSIDKM